MSEVADNIYFAGFGGKQFRFHRSALSLYRVEQEDEIVLRKPGRTALEVLKVLIEEPGRMVPESVLLERVWGPLADKRSLERRLDVQIKNLRSVLEAGAPKEELGCIIGNLPRRGYRFAGKLIPQPGFWKSDPQGRGDSDPADAVQQQADLPCVDLPSPTTAESATVAESVLLIAVIKATTEELRAFTERQQRTIETLRIKLGITERMLQAICRVAVDNGVSDDQLRDKIIEIATECQRVLHDDPLLLYGMAPPISELLEELLTLETIDLMREDGIYLLEGIGRVKRSPLQPDSRAGRRGSANRDR
jgi:DNA-binding winged helix-turn-helix (wHTH) protein